ncbi:hypothetical protein R4Y45_07270 [Holzapfeliella sp. He02]|uniref:Uncharacterized protein n=1 Tax=Holzapfeliella saturejae TaxID=3082953 RepID=A0ABU8SIG0_9LACO
MQTEQIMTRTYKDGTIQLINRDVWKEWTNGNPEFKAIHGLTTVEVPEELLDRAIKFNTQTMVWEDASEDEINQVKTRVKQLSDDLDRTQEELRKAQANSSRTQQERDELKTKVDNMDDTISQLSFQLMQSQGGTENA